MKDSYTQQSYGRFTKKANTSISSPITGMDMEIIEVNGEKCYHCSESGLNFLF